VTPLAIATGLQIAYVVGLVALVAGPCVIAEMKGLPNASLPGSVTPVTE
jgi:hypothetical protein